MPRWQPRVTVSLVGKGSCGRGELISSGPDLTVDVRDAVGDRMHVSDEFKKDGTSFAIGEAQRIQYASSSARRPTGTDGILPRNLHNQVDASASKMVRDARGSRRSRVFPKTAHVVENGPACRVYGSMEVKKVTGNLHIVSWDGTDRWRRGS